MRLILLILLGFAAFPTLSQDSLRDKHYKVRFSIQGKYQTHVFDYQNTNSQIEHYKTYSEGFYSNYQGNIKSTYSFDPELKIDFELPLWLKITCGFSYSKLNYSFTSDRILYTSQNIYAPGSSAHNPVVIGSAVSTTVVGYNRDKSELNRVSTFLGLGMARQYGHFNVDLDYSLAINKVTYAYLTREVYDLNDKRKSTETALFMEDYVMQKDWVFLTHQFSTNLSYRFYRNLHVKAGFQYSKADTPIEDKTSQHYSTFKHMRSYAFIAGIVISGL